MRLASVEVIPYALPFKQPYVTARGRLDRREMALLRLRDEDGLVGLGEAVPLSLRGGAGLEQVVAELEGLVRGSVLSAAVEAGKVGEAAQLPPKLEMSAPSRCAALTALLDLGERCVGVGSPRDPVPCNATLVAAEPAAVAEDALRWAAEGYGTFKLKLGAGDDVEQVRAVREALGPGAQIRVDANADLGPRHRESSAERDRAVRDPAGRAAGGDDGARGRTGAPRRRSRSPATRASRPPTTLCGHRGPAPSA